MKRRYNVLLQEGEAGLPKPSVAIVSQLFTVNKGQLGNYIRTLSAHRVRQVVDGVKLVLEPRDVE